MSEGTITTEAANLETRVNGLGQAALESEVQKLSTTSPYVVAAIALIVSITVCILSLSIYHTFFYKKQKIGTVDIVGVLEMSEIVFAEMLSRKKTESDRQEAFALVRDAGAKLDAALTELQDSCDCILMTSAAVIGKGAIDYTPLVKNKLGLDKVDLKVLKDRIRDSMNTKPEAGVK